MIFYNLTLQVPQDALTALGQEASQPNDGEDALEDVQKFLHKINVTLDYQICTNTLVAQAYQLDKSFLYLACCCDIDASSCKKSITSLTASLSRLMAKSFALHSLQEITAKDFVEKLALAEKNSLYEKKGSKQHYTWLEEFDTGFLSDDSYMLKEEVFDKLPTKRKLLSASQAILPDATLTEELERIYSKKNERNFLGIPVHYKVVANSMESAKKIIEILVNALYNNKRLLGRRTSFFKITDPHQRLDEAGLTSLFSKAQGVTTVISLTGLSAEESTNFSFSANNFLPQLKKNIQVFHKSSLVIFIEILGEAPQADKVMAKFSDCLNVLEIR